MILSRPAIRKELDSGGLVIHPSPRRIDQVSVNLRVGRIFTVFKELTSLKEGYGGRPQDIFQGQSSPVPQRLT